MEETPGLILLTLLLSGACVPEQVLTEHRWAVMEMSTNGICQYGNRMDCCWGWTRASWGQCRPVCELGCKHGECVGPDQCRCHQGYTGNTCNQDVNECGLKPRPCKYRCMNTLGSYKCFCLTGYMMTHNGICRNTQTCAMANCQYGCAVMKGEVMCQCPSPGLRLSSDRRTCVDIDECVMGLAKCPRSRKCVNTFGSYVCTCCKGFELRYINGKYQCIDKNNPCYEKPDSKKCKCKLGTSGWSYDCKFLYTVTVEPARPFTTSRPTTTNTIATAALTTILPTTTKKAAIISSTTTTTSPTTTSTSITTTLETTTNTTPMPTSSIVPITVAMTTAPATVPRMTTIFSTTTVPTTVARTRAPTTVVMSTAPSTIAMTTATIVATTAIPTMVTMTAVPTTTMALPTTMQLITTTLDNHIQEITQRLRGDVYIPRNPDQNVFVDFDDIELGNTAELLHDDAAAGSLSCSFDQGVCSWMTDQDGDLHWETVADPYGGRYLTVHEPKIGRNSRGARLTIPLATPTHTPWKASHICLLFRHRLQGLLIGSLQVFVKKGQGHNPAVWTRTSGQGWRHTQISMWGRGIESVVFKAERRKGRSGEVAIDDVSIHKGLCSNRGHG